MSSSNAALTAGSSTAWVSVASATAVAKPRSLTMYLAAPDGL